MKVTIEMRSGNENRTAAAPGLHLHEVFTRLHGHFGDQHWWPARTRFEVIVGAILTQHTAWKNVERAIANLRSERALQLNRIHEVPVDELAEWIRPSGYYNQKARRLKALVRLVMEAYDGKLGRLLALDTHALREVLLGISGIGPETADCIILYAAKRPVFVVDAYTRRMLCRHGWMQEDAGYDDVADAFLQSLPRDADLFNEYHALMVELGKTYCTNRDPNCTACPLRTLLPHAKRVEIA